MASEIKSLNARNIAALGLVGFSGAFACFLLVHLYRDPGSLVSASLDLAAAVALIAVCAIAWPDIRTPLAARFSWRLAAIVMLAIALAVLARAPGLGG